MSKSALEAELAELDAARPGLAAAAEEATAVARRRRGRHRRGARANARRADRDSVGARIEPTELDRYERLRQRFGGVAVGPPGRRTSARVAISTCRAAELEAVRATPDGRVRRLPAVRAAAGALSGGRRCSSGSSARRSPSSGSSSRTLVSTIACWSSARSCRSSTALGRRRVLHTLVFSLVVLAVVMLSHARSTAGRPLLLGLPIGLLLHLVFDGAWTDTDLFWWPPGGSTSRAPSCRRRSGVVGVPWSWPAWRSWSGCGGSGLSRPSRRAIASGRPVSSSATYGRCGTLFERADPGPSRPDGTQRTGQASRGGRRAVGRGRGGASDRRRQAGRPRRRADLQPAVAGPADGAGVRRARSGGRAVDRAVVRHLRGRCRTPTCRRRRGTTGGSNPAWVPEGGESLAELDSRVRAACRSWPDRARDRTVAVVSHVSPIKTAVAWALGCGVEIGWRSHLSQASVTPHRRPPRRSRAAHRSTRRR